MHENIACNLRLMQVNMAKILQRTHGEHSVLSTDEVNPPQSPSDNHCMT